MKTPKTTWLKLLLLWASLAAAFSAHAFYDPGVQRWLNRDPLGEPGFEIRRQDHKLPTTGTVVVKGANLYRFVNNAAIRFFDSLGLDPSNPACQAVMNAMLTHLSIAGFDESFGNYQGWAEEMAIAMQLAAQYQEMGCNDPPSPPPEPEPDLKPCFRNNRYDNLKTVGVGAGIAGGIYIGYRVIRMIPSLFPPLWPTIPINAAVP